MPKEGRRQDERVGGSLRPREKDAAADAHLRTESLREEPYIRVPRLLPSCPEHLDGTHRTVLAKLSTKGSVRRREV